MGTFARLRTVRRAFVVASMIAAVSGCATTTGIGARSLGADAPEALLGYVVCSGGHASRLPEALKAGQVCRRSAALRDIQ
jgi:hypothetical protein